MKRVVDKSSRKKKEYDSIDNKTESNMKITMGDGTYSVGLSASVGPDGKSESKTMDTFQRVITRGDYYSQQESFDGSKMEKQL